MNLIIFIISLIIIITIFCTGYLTSKATNQQLQQNLQDVSTQNAIVLQSEISSQYNLLLSLASYFQEVSPSTIDEAFSHCDTFVNDYKLKRFAFCFPDGTTYSTDSAPSNLSYRNFFKKGMRGECCISDIFPDQLQPDHALVNVMTIPISDKDGEVNGVFGLAYDAESLNKSLQINSFDNQGYSCIVNESGEIMAVKGNTNLKLSHNIVENLLETDAQNQEGAKELQHLLTSKNSGGGTLYLPEKYYYYCVPVTLMDGSITWHALTLVPVETLTSRVTYLQTYQYITIFLIIALLSVGMLLITLSTKKHNAQINRFAYEDNLTLGPNFMKFCMEFEKNPNRKGHLVAMDIANFSNIAVDENSASRDLMVKETWDIINETLLENELACHVRDDLFIFFLSTTEKSTLIHRLETISTKVLETAKAFRVHGIQARYGVYFFAGDETIESAYSKVKLAKASLSNTPVNNYAFYDENTRVKLQSEKQLIDQFPFAIENEEFEVWYQPKYDMETFTIVGSEALIRWRQRNGQLLTPGQFLPLFCENQMIRQIDEYVFRTVCKQQKQWLDEGKTVYPVSINMSESSIQNERVYECYCAILNEYKLDPKYIQLEITESVMNNTPKIQVLLNQFRSAGIKILMDDFGTGYSSLSSLSTQCFDTLKLDKTLIDCIGNREGEILLYHIIQMGQQLGLHITVEGVERASQLDFLKSLHCNDVQGFYFSKPLSKNAFEAQLEANI